MASLGFGCSSTPLFSSELAKRRSLLSIPWKCATQAATASGDVSQNLWIYVIVPSGKEPAERIWKVEAKTSVGHIHNCSC